MKLFILLTGVFWWYSVFWSCGSTSYWKLYLSWQS